MFHNLILIDYSGCDESGDGRDAFVYSLRFRSIVIRPWSSASHLQANKRVTVDKSLENFLFFI